MEIVRGEVKKLRVTGFGRSPRGRRVLDEVEAFVKRDRIVFSAHLNGPRGLSWTEVLGLRLVYVRVIEMAAGRHLHQLPCQISEVLCHEAVHSIRGGLEGASIEEECDAFAAGLCADAASRGQEVSVPLQMDGMPLAEFVMESYPDAPRDPGYQPVGRSTEWLRKMTGLE